MQAMKVWVVLGGLSAERDVALESGHAVAQALSEKGHDVLVYDLGEGAFLPELSSHRIPADLPVALAAGERRSTETASEAADPEGWRGLGWAERLLKTARLLRTKVDVAFLALHGGAGEDGTVQALLETVPIPYSGSGPAASALAMDKALTKRVMTPLGIQTPRWVTFPPPESQEDIPEMPWSPPLVVKPVAEGSSVGITIVHEKSQWAEAIRSAAAAGGASKGQNPEILVEQYIDGRELTVAILEGEPLPVVEIIPLEGFYDFSNKYTAGACEYRVPADLPSTPAARLQHESQKLFRTLGCRGMARVDYRMVVAGVCYCLELNTIPGLTATSLLPKAAAATGVDFGGLLERICADAIASARARVSRPAEQPS